MPGLTNSNMNDKKRELRQRIIEQRDLLSAQDIADKSNRIAQSLYRQPAYCNAEAVMFFIAFGSEVDTKPMVEETIKRGKQALAPKALPETRELIPSQVLDLNRDLQPGAYNILEPREDTLRPRDPEMIDLLLVPGVGFDLKKRRLGYGGGYYDRFFERLKPQTPLVALAFELQILPEIPVDDWDRRVDLIITESRVIY